MKSLHGFTLADLKVRTRPGKGGCWLWTGNCSEYGYARASHKDMTIYVHPLAYRLAKGRVPSGMSLLHTCGHAHCINPAHMRPVTRKQLVRWMVKTGAFSCGSSHPGAKLTEAKVRRIRQTHAQGKLSCVTLGKNYGVDSTLILRIVQRKKWRHVV
jgi:hypothetical protein